MLFDFLWKVLLSDKNCATLQDLNSKGTLNLVRERCFFYKKILGKEQNHYSLMDQVSYVNTV